VSTPTSATGTSSRAEFRSDRRLASGFTLLELLVVVAIIGIMVGVAVLSTDLISFDRRIGREATRLKTVIKYTAEESLMQSRDFGILFYEDAYRFMLFDPATLMWRPLDDDGAFAVHKLPEDIVVELRMEDHLVDLDRYSALYWERKQDAQQKQDTKKSSETITYPTPQVMILSSGELTPFAIEFLRESEILEPGIQLAVEFDGQSEITHSEL
jgi:general secretion pathway protein H